MCASVHQTCKEALQPSRRWTVGWGSAGDGHAGLSIGYTYLSLQGKLSMKTSVYIKDFVESHQRALVKLSLSSGLEISVRVPNTADSVWAMTFLSAMIFFFIVQVFLLGQANVVFLHLPVNSSIHVVPHRTVNQLWNSPVATRWRLWEPRIWLDFTWIHFENSPSFT